MGLDFSSQFERYEALVGQVDSLFERIAGEHPSCVKCNVGCSDCCHALFDITLVEAIYLNSKFMSLPEETRRPVLEAANAADRAAYRIKRDLFKRQQKGEDPNELLHDAATKRVRCPLLMEDQTCLLYSSRPITCRVYGIPMNIGGKSATCGLSGFEKGQQYPAVQMDRIQARLHELSRELVTAVKSIHIEMETILVPVSMALLTTYDETYLGVPAQSAPKKQGPASWDLPGPSEEK